MAKYFCIVAKYLKLPLNKPGMKTWITLILFRFTFLPFNLEINNGNRLEDYLNENYSCP